ncbi:hypothetical protein [Cerasicoccus fimbriatus]|uniref:hypothetical protein n=1 Tax=Cerasicoccus fimbriatus TaxID=3014554 RepID=UPI0022B44F65|nr:hypothetical protein [Cerasicoccus sp. TK19100]
MRKRLLSMFLFPLALAGVARAESESYYAGINPDAEMVLVANLESLLASPLVQQIQAMVQQFDPESDPNSLPMELTTYTGATSQDVGKIVLSASDVLLLQEINDPSQVTKEQMEKTGVMITVQINKAIDAAKFNEWVEMQTPPAEKDKTTKSDVGKGVMYSSTDDSGLAMGFLPGESETLIMIGSDTGVTSGLKTGKGELPAKLATAASLSSSLPNIAIMASPSADWKEQLVASAKENMDGEDDTVFVEEAEQFLFGINITDSLNILSGIKFANQETANEAFNALSEAVADFQSEPMEPGPMTSLFVPLVNRMSVTEDGEAVTFSTGMNAGESQQMLMMLPMLILSQMQNMQGPAPAGGGM